MSSFDSGFDLPRFLKKQEVRILLLFGVLDALITSISNPCWLLYLLNALAKMMLKQFGNEAEAYPLLCFGHSVDLQRTLRTKKIFTKQRRYCQKKKLFEDRRNFIGC